MLVMIACELNLATEGSQHQSTVRHSRIADSRRVCARTAEGQLPSMATLRHVPGRAAEGLRPLLSPNRAAGITGTACASSGTSRSSLRRVLLGGCQLFRSEGEALEVVVNASVLRIVRIHQVSQSSDHFVLDFGS